MTSIPIENKLTVRYLGDYIVNYLCLTDHLNKYLSKAVKEIDEAYKRLGFTKYLQSEVKVIKPNNSVIRIIKRPGAITIIPTLDLNTRK